MVTWSKRCRAEQARVAGRIAALSLAVLVSLVVVVSNAAAQSRYTRQTGSARSVIVFVHGVLSDSTTAWTNTTTKAFWPTLLTEDDAFQDEDIYVYEYATPSMRESFSIDEIADNMRLQFDSDSVTTGHDQIIFVAHSMGGLAVRAYLLKYREVAQKTKLIYFFSTPTTGSEISSIAAFLSANPQFGKMRPMNSADYLADVQRQWLAASFGIRSYCAYEKRKTYGFSIVNQASAASLCTQRLDPIDADHIDIVKPASNREAQYLAFKSAYNESNLVKPGLKQRTDAGNGSSLALMRADPRDISGDFSACPYRETDGRYSIAATVTLSFKSSNFNDEDYLRGFETVAIGRLPEGGTSEAHAKDEGDYRRSALRSANVRSADAFDEAKMNVHAKEMEARTFNVYIKVRNKPRKSDAFEVAAGTQRWVVKFGDLNWSQYPACGGRVSEPWWGAAAAIHLEADDPDWVVLRAARALAIKGDKSSATKDFFLELIVENRTATRVAVTDVLVKAWQGKTFHCYCPDCRPQKPQEVLIDWPIILQRAPTATTRQSVLVTMADAVVQAPVQFTTASCLEDTLFSSSLPIQFDIPPNDTGRVLLRFKEKALQEKHAMAATMPESLLQWNHVQVSIKPTRTVFPKSVDLP